MGRTWRGKIQHLQVRQQTLRRHIGIHKKSVRQTPPQSPPADIDSDSQQKYSPEHNDSQQSTVEDFQKSVEINSQESTDSQN